MRILTEKINLDLNQNGIQATIDLREGDIESRLIIATLRGYGDAFRPDDNVIAVIRAKKPDGTIIYNNCLVEDGKVKFLVSSQYAAVEGNYNACIELIKDGVVLYSPKFSFHVAANELSDSEVESSSEYTELTTALEQALTALELAQNLHLLKFVENLEDEGDEKYLYVLTSDYHYIPYVWDAENERYMQLESNLEELAEFAYLLNIQKERVDNLLAEAVPGSTTRDLEVIDGRTGYDGRTYANLGIAIREQINDLHSDNTTLSNNMIAADNNLDNIKANKTDVNTTTANIEAEISIERARIDNIASLEEGSTTGDAELTDIRIGEDGNTYSSAGDAVRGQFKNITQNLYQSKQDKWGYGLFTAVGAIVSGNGAYSSVLKNINRIVLSNNCKTLLRFYANGDYLGKLNESGTLDKNSSSWKYLTGTINILYYLDLFNADSFQMNIVPTDGTTLSDSTVQTFGDNNVSLLEDAYATKKQLNDDVTNISKDIYLNKTMPEIYERKEVSSAYNSYTTYTQENPTRARIKQEYIQKVPENATSATIFISNEALGYGKYKVGWAFYTDDFVQIFSTVLGWYTSEGTYNINSIPSNAKYFMYYYATNSASSITLSEIKHDKNRITFNTSDTNYAFDVMHYPVNKELLDQKKYFENQISAINTKNIADTFIFSVNHRGYSTDAPENTLPAFILSKKKHFKYVETDIQFTSDGVGVLLHDNTINRTARNIDGTELSDTVYISDITYEDALDYDFGIWKGEEYAGTKIPTLEEFLVLCKKLSIHPFLELKDVVGGTYWTAARIKYVADLIKKVGMVNNVSFLSFSVSALNQMKEIFPENKLVLGYEGVYSEENFDDFIDNLISLKSDDNKVLASVSYLSMNETLYNKLTASEINPFVWTVNSTSAILNLNETVAGVLSDLYNAGEIIEDDILI